jgi:hypothetical protein
MVQSLSLMEDFQEVVILRLARRGVTFRIMYGLKATLNLVRAEIVTIRCLSMG